MNQPRTLVVMSTGEFPIYRCRICPAEHTGPLGLRYALNHSQHHMEETHGRQSDESHN